VLGSWSEPPLQDWCAGSWSLGDALVQFGVERR